MCLLQNVLVRGPWTSLSIVFLVPHTAASYTIETLLSLVCSYESDSMLKGSASLYQKGCDCFTQKQGEETFKTFTLLTMPGACLNECKWVFQSAISPDIGLNCCKMRYMRFLQTCAQKTYSPYSPYSSLYFNNCLFFKVKSLILNSCCV